MIKISNKRNCCGCEACVQACPKKCIDFIPDSQGFLYPKVNESLCVNCGLCNKVCPVLNVKEHTIPSSTPVYAAYNKNSNQRSSSSSGGIFSILASDVIKKNGVVFGALFDKDWKVVHGYAENNVQIEPLKRSKYVQSRIGNSYKEVKAFLRQGREVMFVGTPCQVAGLKQYLQKNYDNLITVDVICHGVPSPMIWTKYLQEKKSEIASLNNGCSDNDIEFTSISFRDKVESWRRFHLSFTYKVKKDGIDAIAADSIIGTQSKYIWEDDYMLSFLKDYANRPSCFDCKFRNGKCRSDITLADFWNVKECLDDEEMTGEHGTSLVLVNTSKGEKYFQIDCEKIAVDFRMGTAGNPALRHDWPEPLGHDSFFVWTKKMSIHESLERAQKLNSKFGKIYNIYQRVIRKVRKWQK
jgi:ferredoxin